MLWMGQAVLRLDATACCRHADH